MARKTSSIIFGLVFLGVLSAVCLYWAITIARDMLYRSQAWGSSLALLIRGGWLVVFYLTIAVASGWAPMFAIVRYLKEKLRGPPRK